VAHFVLERTLKTPVQPIRGLAFGGENPVLAALTDDGDVRVWNTATGDLLHVIPLVPHPREVSCLAFSPDGKWVVVGEAFTKMEVFTAKLALLDVLAGREVRTLATHHWQVESLDFSRDGKFLVSSDWDRKVRLMRFPSGEQVREFQCPSKPHGVAISPDAQLIASAGSGGTVTLWYTATGSMFRRFTGQTGDVLSVAFSPDSRRLVSAGTDGSVRIWDVSTGQCLHTLGGHAGPVMAAVFSPDGRFVVSGGADRTTRLWDAATGQSLETLGALSQVWQVAFSSDGKYLAAGGADGTINVWHSESRISRFDVDRSDLLTRELTEPRVPIGPPNSWIMVSLKCRPGRVNSQPCYLWSSNVSKKAMPDL